MKKAASTLLKTTLTTIVTLVAGAQSYAATPEPLLRFKFDTEGPAQISSGSAGALPLFVYDKDSQLQNYVTPVPGGKPGAAHALNLTETNVGGSGGGLLNYLSPTESYLTTDLGSFTVTASIFDLKSRGKMRLFTLLGATLGVEISLNGIDSNGNSVTGQGAVASYLSLSLHHPGNDPATADSGRSLTIQDTDDAWQFIAVSYDATTGKVDFYTGVQGTSLNHSTSSLTLDGGAYPVPTGSTIITVGNSYPGEDFRLSAYLSEFQFYGSALSRDDIATLYSIPIPEHTSNLSAFIGFGVIAALKAYSRKP